MQKTVKLPKRTVRVCALLLLTASLLLCANPVRADDPLDYSKYIVRVGLVYGSSSPGYATFTTTNGSGFKMGYFGSDRSFAELYDVDGETAVTVIRSYNFDISSKSYAADGSTSSSVVGGYHLELSTAFDDQAGLDAGVTKVFAATNYVSFPAFTTAGYRVRIGRFTSSAAAEEAKATLLERLATVYPDATLRVVANGKNAYTVLRADTRTILYEFDGATKQLGIMPYGASATETKFGSYKYLGGFDFVQTTSKTFAVISVVDLVQYTKGVTPYELGPNWPDETLKAHAVCAATFGVANKNRHASYGFDVCTGQHCQVYRGTTSATVKTNSCVNSVAGTIAVYKGTPINAVYHSTNGGYTENSENVWVAVIPYLRAVPDTFETLTYGNNGLWTNTLTGAQITSKLRAAGYSIGTVTRVWVSKFTDAGNVYSISCSDGTNTVTLLKENMRTVMGMNVLLSQRFQVVAEGAVFVNSASGALEGGLSGAYVIDGSGAVSALPSGSRSAVTSTGIVPVESGSADEFTFDGRGWGHNLGLSQYGSKGRADAGWTYDQILKYYFTGIDLTGIG